MSSSTGSNTSPDPAAAKTKSVVSKPPTARKRKATEDSHAAEPLELDVGQTKRQTRQASAAQELQRKEEEAENNVGKRTRSALSKP